MDSVISLGNRLVTTTTWIHSDSVAKQVQEVRFLPPGPVRPSRVLKALYRRMRSKVSLRTFARQLACTELRGNQAPSRDQNVAAAWLANKLQRT